MYTNEIWRINSAGKPYIYDEITPTVGSQTISEIPWVFVNAYDVEAETQGPPMVGLADLNIDHFRLDADLKYRPHIMGLPPGSQNSSFRIMLPLEGVGGSSANPDDVLSVPLGSPRALVSPEAEARPGFLQVEGAFDGIVNEKEADEKRMVRWVLGCWRRRRINPSRRWRFRAVVRGSSRRCRGTLRGRSAVLR